MIPISYNLRNLKSRKTTTAAAAGGLALVVFVFSSVMMLSNGITKTLGTAGSPDVAVVLSKGATGELESNVDEGQVRLVLASPEIGKSASGAPAGGAEIVIVVLLDRVGDDGVTNVTIRGMTEDSAALRPNIKVVEGRKPTPGSAEVMVGKAISGRFKGTALGESFDLAKNRPMTIVGVFADGGSSSESEVWGDFETIQTAAGRDTVVSSIRVKVDPANLEQFNANLEANRQLAVKAVAEPEYLAKLSEGTSTFVTVLGVLIAIFFSIGAMIGAMITMHASIAHRQREIGTLRALGFGRFTILLSFLLESLLLALLGGAVGAAASLGMRFVSFSTMNFASWSEIVFRFEPTPNIIVTSLVLAAFMGIIGGFFPALRAARMNPIEAMRG